MELLEKTLWFIGFLAICLLFVPLMIRKKGVRIFVISLCSISLTWLTLFILNEPSWRWGDIHNQIAFNKSFNNDDGFKFANENFVLVDNASDKAFRPDPEEDLDDSLQTVITDRRKLYNLISLLNNYPKLVDLVIIDIGFDLTTEYDSVLRYSLMVLASKNKLMLTMNSDSSVNPTLTFDDSLYGDSRERTNEKLFVSHYTHRENSVSLPYKLYQKFNKKTAHEGIGKLLMIEKGQNKSRFFQNPFFPDFKITNEPKLLFGFDPNKSKEDVVEYEDGNNIYFKLGKTINDRNRADFIATLNTRKEEGKSNIILIGAFTSADEDTHQTLYGRMHGPVILINIYYALVKGQHLVSITEILIMLLAFAFICSILIYSSLGIKLITLNWQPAPVSYRKKGGSFLLLNILELIWRMLLAVIHFIFVDELPYTLIFAFSTLFYLGTGKVINILSLLFFFGLMEKAIHYSKKHQKP